MRITINLNEKKANEKEIVDFLNNSFNKSTTIKEALRYYMLREQGIVITKANVETKVLPGVDKVVDDDIEIVDTEGMVGL